jgi:hypothetical protein
MYSKKMTRFVAVSAMAFFLGATSLIHAQVPPPDADGDGIEDANDLECPASDISDTVVIDGIDTGIPNITLPSGCTLTDVLQEAIDTCLDGAKNHGKFVSCVSHETNFLKRAKTITGKQKGKIQSIVAKMR